MIMYGFWDTSFRFLPSQSQFTVQDLFWVSTLSLNGADMGGGASWVSNKQSEVEFYYSQPTLMTGYTHPQLLDLHVHRSQQQAGKTGILDPMIRI